LSRQTRKPHQIQIKGPIKSAATTASQRRLCWWRRRNKAKITAFQGYLTDLVAQGKALKAQGRTAEQTALEVDLTKYRDEFPQIQGKGADIRGVRRLYAWLDARK